MTPGKARFNGQMIHLIKKNSKSGENKAETQGGTGNADYDKPSERHVPKINHFNVCAPFQHLDDPLCAFQS